MRNMLRCLLVILVFAGGATPAHACPSADLQHTIFFEKIPPDFYPGSDFRADVVADVVLEEVRGDRMHGIVNARVKNAIKGEIKAGEHIQLHYDVTSCGPYPRKGEDGMIAAQYGDAGDGQKILIALTRPMGL